MTTGQYNDKNDTELLDHFYNDGDNKWLGILLQRYTAMLLGVSMKYLKNEEDAKDSVQQIFLKVIHELQKYKVAYFKSWLYMIAKNHCLMKLRDKNKIPGELNENITIATDDEEQKTLATAKENNLNDLDTALTLLNDGQRVCVTLFYLNKQTYQEIALATGLTVLQVKSNIQNGKRNLKIQMQIMKHHE